MADSAFEILQRNGRKVTANFFIDDEVLLDCGLTEKDIDKVNILELLPHIHNHTSMR
jgi:hypothetical protein